MSKVGQWLFEMQEDAFNLLITYPADEARRLFLMQHIGQDDVFERCRLEWDGELPGEPDIPECKGDLRC